MAKKKGNGEGSINKRKDGRYMGRYTVDGKRCAVYGDTFEETRARLTEVLAGIDKGTYLTPSNETLSCWVWEWLRTYALPTVKQNCTCVPLKSPQTVFKRKHHKGIKLLQRLLKWLLQRERREGGGR